IRSRVVPQTSASDTAQNTNWKKNFDSIVAFESDITGKLGWYVVTPSAVAEHGPRSEKKKPPSWPPAPPTPHAHAKPQTHQPTAAIEKLVRIFATTVPAFLPRENPISRKAKPACMNITSAPATITHIVLIPTDWSSLPATAFSRSVASASANPGTASITAAAARRSPPTADLRLIRS